MTLNLTELNDEPLGKHPKHAFACGAGRCLGCFIDGPVAEQVDVADDEGAFKFDVEDLGDEALDPRRHVSALFACCAPPSCRVM